VSLPSPRARAVCVYESDKTVGVLNYSYVQHIYDTSDSVAHTHAREFSRDTSPSATTRAFDARRFRSLKMMNDASRVPARTFSFRISRHFFLPLPRLTTRANARTIYNTFALNVCGDPRWWLVTHRRREYS